MSIHCPQQQFIVPVVPELSNPLKVVDVPHVLLHHLVHHIACVYLYHDESRQDDTPQLGEFSPHKGDQISQLCKHLLIVLVKTAIHKSLGDLSGPVGLAPCYHHLTRPLEHPLCTGNFLVVLEGLAYDLFQRGLHDTLHIEQPVLHVAHRVQGLTEGHVFSLT